MEAFLKPLNDLINSSTWPVLQIGLRVVFFLIIFRILWLMFYFREKTSLMHLAKPKKAFGVLFACLALLFIAAIAYQATWQLAGSFRPDFVAFMQRHDRRQFNPAHRVQRGRILDHRGQILAFSQEYQGEVYRLYPHGPAFAHVVGYSHPKFGVAGMESVANVHLNGGTLNKLEGWGELGRQLVTTDKRPRGQDLVLTLDADLQLKAFERLKGHRGAIILLRPADGAILAMTSAPSYDPNRITAALLHGRDPATPLLNRATQGFYPPGSTFKVVMAALGLNQGFKGTLHCPADGFTTSRYNRKIRDHGYYLALRDGKAWKGYGSLDLTDALAKSSNVFFAQLGVKYGHNAFYENAKQLYFNNRVSLHENLHGRWVIKTGKLSRIKDSDQYGLAQMSLGQGKVLATPAHMALIAAAIARGGVAMKPRLVQSEPPTPLARFMTADTARQLAVMMRRVVTDGTARSINNNQLAIAGKTGTAQNPHGAAHSWFIGFAPTNRPALAICVMVEHGGYGSRTAAPIARDLFLEARKLGLLN